MSSHSNNCPNTIVSKYSKTRYPLQTTIPLAGNMSRSSAWFSWDLG